MNRLFLFLYLSLFIISLPTHAVDLYGELGAGYLMNDVDQTEFDSITTELRFGAYVQPQVGIELYAGVGVNDDKQIDIESGLSYMAGLAVRLESPESEGGKIFFLLGYGVAEIDVDRSGSGEPGKQSFDAVNYGLGAEFRLGNRNDLFLTVKGVRYYSKSGIGIDVAGLGIRAEF